MIEDAKRILRGHDSNHRLTSGELGRILTALVKDMPDKADVDRFRQVGATLKERYDDLPKFDLDAATDLLSNNIDIVSARAFRAYHNGPEPTRPEPKFEVGGKVLYGYVTKTPSTMLAREWRNGRWAYRDTYGNHSTWIDEECYQPAPDRPLEVGDKVTVKAEVTFEIEAEAREEGHVVIGPPTTDAPIVVPLNWLTRLEE